jgi:hypothetical protein
VSDEFDESIPRLPEGIPYTGDLDSALELSSSGSFTINTTDYTFNHPSPYAAIIQGVTATAGTHTHDCSNMAVTTKTAQATEGEFIAEHYYVMLDSSDASDRIKLLKYYKSTTGGAAFWYDTGTGNTTNKYGSNLTGTFVKGTDSSKVVGTGTSFLSEIKAGDVLQLGTEDIRVASVKSDTILFLSSATSTTHNGVTGRVPNIRIDKKNDCIIARIYKTGANAYSIFNYAKRSAIGSVASKTVRLTASQYVIPYTLADTESATITFTASATNFGTEDRTYKFYVDNVLKQTTTNTDDEEEFVLADGDEPANGEQITVKVEIIQGSTTVIDSTSIYGIKDGAEAFTVILDNEAHTIPATETGAPITFSNSGTNIKVFLGTTALNYGTSGANTFSVTANASGITKGTPTGSGTNWYSGVATAMGASTRSATITYSIVARDAAEVATTFTKIQSFSKGNDGVDADALTSTSSTVNGVTTVSFSDGSNFTINDGTTKGVAAIFASSSAGASQSYTQGSLEYVNYYEYTGAKPTLPVSGLTWVKYVGEAGDSEGVLPIYAEDASGTNASFTLGSRTFVNFYEWTVSAPTSVPSGLTYVKFIGTDGTSTLRANLSNDIHTIPAEFNGANGNFTGASTTLTILEGTTDVTSSWSISTAVSSGTTISGAGTASVAVTAMNNSTTSGTVTFTATRTNYATLTAVFSFTKQNAAEEGDPAIVYRIGGATGAVTKNTNGTFTPANFTANAQKIDGENTPASTTDGTLKVYRNGSATASATATGASSISWPVTSGTTTIKVDLIVGTTIVDSETIPIVSDGTSPISFTLSNHAFNVACDNSGTPLANAFVGSGTDLKVFEGDNPLSYSSGGGSAGTFSIFANGGATVATNVTRASATAPAPGVYGAYYVELGDITAMSADTGDITFTVAGKRHNGTVFPAFDVVQSFTKVRGGDSVDFYFKRIVAGGSLANPGSAATSNGWNTNASTFAGLSGTLYAIKGTLSGTTWSWGVPYAIETSLVREIAVYRRNSVAFSDNGTFRFAAPNHATTALRTDLLTAPTSWSTIPLNTQIDGDVVYKSICLVTGEPGQTVTPSWGLPKIYTERTDGEDAFNAVLGWTSRVVPRDSSGNPDLTGTGNTVTLYRGGALYGTFSVTTSATNITAAAPGSGNPLSYGAATNWGNTSTDLATIVYTVTPVVGGVNQASIILTSTFTLAPVGAIGNTGFLFVTSLPTASNYEEGQVVIVEASAGAAQQGYIKSGAQGGGSWTARDIVNHEIIFANAIRSEQLQISSSDGSASGIFMNSTAGNNSIEIYDGTTLRVKIGKL